jgi:N1221-like protein
VSLGRVKIKPGSRVDVVVGGKGGGKGEEVNGDQDKGGRGETRAGSVTKPVRNSRVAKNGHVRLIRQHPFQPYSIIMVSPPHARVHPFHLQSLSPQSNDLDSITLGQLKAMVNSAPKPKARTSPLCIAYLVYDMTQQCYYDFKYDDEDTVLNEIEEFYSYVEMPQAAENLKAWEGSFQGGMCELLSCLAPRYQFKRSRGRMDQESTAKAQSTCGATP